MSGNFLLKVVAVVVVVTAVVVVVVVLDVVGFDVLIDVLRIQLQQKVVVLKEKVTNNILFGWVNLIYR